MLEKLTLLPTSVITQKRFSELIRDVNETRESRVSIFFLDPGKGISASHRPGTALGPASDRPSPFAPSTSENRD